MFSWKIIENLLLDPASGLYVTIMLLPAEEIFSAFSNKHSFFCVFIFVYKILRQLNLRAGPRYLISLNDFVFNALYFRAKSRIADRIRKKERRKAERESRDNEDNDNTKKRRVNKEI